MKNDTATGKEEKYEILSKEGLLLEEIISKFDTLILCDRRKNRKALTK